MTSKCATRAAALLSVLLLLLFQVAANDVEDSEAANQVDVEANPTSIAAPSETTNQVDMEANPTSIAAPSSAEAGEYEDSCDEKCRLLNLEQYLRIELRALTGASEVARWEFVEQPSRDTWKKFVSAERNRTEGWRTAVGNFSDIIWSASELKDFLSDNRTARHFYALNQNMFIESASFHLDGAGPQEKLDRLRAFLLHRFGVAASVLNLTNIKQLVREVAALSPINLNSAGANADRRTRLFLQRRALSAWLHWCDSVGPLLKPAFTQLVQTLNDKTRLIPQFFGYTAFASVFLL